MVALGQTIAVIDKSGKVVSNSKHLFGVFKEARSAYRERKAEIQATKLVQDAERDARRAMATFTLDDGRSAASSKRYPGRSRSVVRHGDQDHHHSRRASHQFEQDLHSTHSRPLQRELSRRHTSHEVATKPQHMHPGTRSHSTPHIDMDLAYGEYHPSALERINLNPQQEVNTLVAKAKDLLVEAECAQHSVTHTIAHLQKNPEAMAAVALTLAEISNLASKMAPAALAALKSSAPAVFALLSSPHFMIAAGVGIGVTIVMFGGYKIIKRIQEANNSNSQQGSTDELIELELNSSVSRVETWRRGVADYEACSAGTSVDGEFITPTAAAMSGIYPASRVRDLRSEYGSRSVRGAESVRDTASDYSRTTRSSRRSRQSKAPTEFTVRSKRAPTEVTVKSKKDKKDKDKKSKKPSPLRLLFKPSSK
ncbi:hypothetical protein FQN50_008762 [Emmonsiellopsis sp. PD_5]|nr:hypothetical protein FQN50_008762 [Emmonsiellopsis sp. PD_5]